MPPEPRMLSDEEISTIANDVRTLPLAEVGRHVMPLIQHITASESRICHRCRFWVPYNQSGSTASVGECTYHYSHDAKMKIIFASEGIATTTPFDWSCSGWEPRGPDDDTTQMEAR